MVPACRVCLVTDTKMFNVNTMLHGYYQELTGLQVPQNGLPEHLCWECSHRLASFISFKHKALRSYNFLMQMTWDTGHIPNIHSINRHENKLVSNLTNTDAKTNQFDLYIDFAELDPIKKEDDPVKLETRFSATADEVKVEVVSVDFINDKDTENITDTIDTAELADVIDEPIEPVKKVKNKKKHKHVDDAPPDFVSAELLDNEAEIDDVKVRLRRKKKAKVIAKVLSDVSDDDDYNPVDFDENSSESDTEMADVPKKRERSKKTDLNEEIFTVSNLSFEEQIGEVKKREGTSNYRNSAYKCSACFKGFKNQETYSTHMIRHSDNIGHLECRICKIRFKKKHALQNHERKHTTKYSCKMCSFTTMCRHAAKLHTNFHDGSTYQCPHCAEVYTKFTSYFTHLRIKHPSDHHICELCGNSFVSKLGLTFHKKKKHLLDDTKLPENAPTCDKCNVRFMSVEALETHFRTSSKHTVEKPMTGRQGRRTMNKPRNIERDDTKNKGPFPCEQCGMELPDPKSYAHHFRSAHPYENRTRFQLPDSASMLMCETCGKMFRCLTILEDHRLVHTGVKKFTCERCNKSFYNKQQLCLHMYTHRGKRYPCDECGKQFSNSANMQRHKLVHTGLKPYKCEICDKSFTQVGDKKMHITYVHLKKPWPKRTRRNRGVDIKQSPRSILSASETDTMGPISPSSSHGHKIHNAEYTY